MNFNIKIYRPVLNEMIAGDPQNILRASVYEKIFRQSKQKLTRSAIANEDFLFGLTKKRIASLHAEHLEIPANSSVRAC